MGLFSRGGSILATSISRNVNWRQFRSSRSNHGIGADLQKECVDVNQQRRQVGISVVCHASCRPVEVDPVGIGCSDGELYSRAGFRVLSDGEEFIQHIGDQIPREFKNYGCSSFEIGHVKKIKCRGWGLDMDQTTASAGRETAENPVGRVLACGEETMQGSIRGPGPGRNWGSNRLELENMMEMNYKTVDIEVEQSAATQNVEMGKEGMLNAVDMATGIVYESSETSASNYSRSTTVEDAIPSGQIELVQHTEVNLPLDNLPSKRGGEDGNSQYPVPLSPLSGELAKGIEYERAMVAETAVKSGPAMARSGVLFEDEWLMVVNKPCGMYCEHVLATIPSLLTPAADFSSLSRLTLRRPADS